MSLANYSLEELLNEAQRRINCARAAWKGVILVGPPGAAKKNKKKKPGKGSQAPKLKDEYCLCHISTGDALRAAVAQGTELGKKAKAIMEKGELVPDDLVNGIVGEAIDSPQCAKGFILDGYPRTVSQAQSLEKLLKEKKKNVNDVVQLDVPDSILEERITGRRVHKASGRTYHTKFSPPKQKDKDDVTGEPLIQRPDDTAEVLKPRLGEYHKHTSPVLEFYKQKGLVRRVDANDKFDVVWERIKSSMNTKKEPSSQ
ncbi:hypothetical protein RFI_06560 [Reticulomyxa filosa]|uniref:Adenylate kinase active site lid domain-containing protein n=1 Tax=Reticulomyxa filosa TaxID=46433 RepID=X6NW76_RETFI|nr:hypothetical protein RFI_06560 [Reticulomyxa filosa]|eukprot:ETO30560.1 hypothetical protein RFI_06560 [Reticulomyxa filosa]